MRFFRIEKWEKYQHYAKARPRWVKVYTTINDMDTDWRCLDDATIGQLIRMVAYAANNENTLPFDGELLKELLGCDRDIDLELLCKSNIIKAYDSKEACLSIERSRLNSRLNSRENSSVPRSEREREIEVEEYTDKSKTRIRVSVNEDINLVAPRRLSTAFEHEVEIVMSHLRMITERNFTNEKGVRACMKREKCGSGPLLEVLGYLYEEWGSNDEMAKFINPITPFRAIHFAGYLDESRAGPVVARKAPQQEKKEADARIARLKP